MKRSHIVMLVVCLLLIPLTLFFGTKLPGSSWYITGTLLIVELMLPFFLAFEGRRIQARELVLLAVLCALAIAGRAAIPIPHFKAVFAVILLTGVAFGPESGFMVGAITALVSNFFFGQGPFTPWQMFAYGVCGMLAGFAFYKKRLPQKAWVMAVFGFLSVILIVGPLLDSSHIFLMVPQITWEAVAASLLSGLPVNCSQALCTALLLLLLGRPLLDKLDRVKQKYGMTEDENGL